MEAGPPQGMHHGRPGEGLGQEHRPRMVLVDLGDEPLPETDGFGMWIIHPKDPYPAFDPQVHDAQHFGAEALRVVVEVQRVDVLILLRRVLGVGDAPVGPGGKPFGMLGHPRMVGGSLQGQIQGHFEAQIVGALHERSKIRCGAQIRMDGVVAACRGTDSPR